jgi:DNA-binding HxlR family transcriptional regulator/peroxiredoxin
VRKSELANEDCGIAQALGVLGDWWTFLILRDIAGGATRFDALQRGLGVSRRVLTERLAALVEHDVVRRRLYSEHPPRADYLLTAKGEGLLPILIALQDWGTRHVLGDGSLTATAQPASAEARRVLALVGRRLPDAVLTRHDGQPQRVHAVGSWLVLYLFPGAFAPGDQSPPSGWHDIPGARGCTVESSTYADGHADFVTAGARVVGVSTQSPDQLAAFVAHAQLPFPLLSDQDGRLAAGLFLPTFRAGGLERFKRLSLLVDPDAVIRSVQFPIPDPAGSVAEMLQELRQRSTAGAPSRQRAGS